jgi:hypothetical protein
MWTNVSFEGLVVFLWKLFAAVLFNSLVLGFFTVVILFAIYMIGGGR